MRPCAVCIILCLISGQAAAFQPIISTWRLHRSSLTRPIDLISSPLLRLSRKHGTVLKSKSNTNETGYRITTFSYPRKTRATAVYALILINIGVFLADKVFHLPFVTRYLYLFHRRWSWWQPLTTCFCHTNRNHLSSNLFLLLVFGRSVEDFFGWGGLILSFVFCGVIASMVSLMVMPKSTLSIGASGAVFGLFAVFAFTKLSWKALLDWRTLVEVVVLGEFFGYGIDHVGHLSGILAGIVVAMVMGSILPKVT